VTCACSTVLHCGIVRPDNMPQVPDVVSGAIGKVSGSAGMLCVCGNCAMPPRA
jgi:hypothetical protein